MDEAKDLYDQLNEIFGNKITYLPSAPVIIERNKWHNPYTPYWYGPSSVSEKPLNLPGIMCSVSCDSGLKVSYCGDEVK